MLQGMELTRTNRSCGLTTYFSQRWSCERLYRRRHAADPRSVFEARREKVEAIDTERVPSGRLVETSEFAMNSTVGAHPSATI